MKTWNFIFGFLLEIFLVIADPCTIDLDSRTGSDPPFIINSNKAIIYPQNGRTLSIDDGEEIALYCHGTPKRSSKLDKSSTPALASDTSFVPLICSNGIFLYTVNQQQVNVLTASCTASQQPEMTLNYEECASIGADGRTGCLYQLFKANIQWNFDGTVQKQVEVCADERVYGTLWVKYTIRGKSIDYRDTTPGRPTFRTDTTREYRFFSKATSTDVTNAYSKSSQAEKVSNMLGTNNKILGTDITIIDTDSSGTNYLARGHLAPDANFIYNVEQDATYYFMNVAPQFQSFNNGNWKSIEGELRSIAATRQRDVTVYTGIHGILSYPDINGTMTDIYLMDIYSLEYIPTPQFMWTLLYDEESFEAIMFIGLNDPHAVDISGLNFCNSVCAELPWITQDFNMVEKGAFQCCQVDAALKMNVPTVPDLSDANNNWPSLLKTY